MRHRCEIIYAYTNLLLYGVCLFQSCFCRFYGFGIPGFCFLFFCFLALCRNHCADKEYSITWKNRRPRCESMLVKRCLGMFWDLHPHCLSESVTQPKHAKATKKIFYFEWSPPWHLCNSHSILSVKYANTHRSKASSTFFFLYTSLVKQLPAWFISSPPDKESTHWLSMPDHVSTLPGRTIQKKH